MAISSFALIGGFLRFLLSIFPLWSPFFFALTPSLGVFFWLKEVSASAPPPPEETLVILSPHRESMKNEFIPNFLASYPRPLKVEWLNQVGGSVELNFVLNRCGNLSPKEPCSIHLFWGGGEQTHYALEEAGLSIPYALPKPLEKQIPSSLARCPLKSSRGTWQATALVTFGILYNKHLVKTPMERWEDLTHPSLQDQVVLVDPRMSSSALTILAIILESMGWDEGWRTLIHLGGQSRKFLHSGTETTKMVASGAAAAGASIDYFALAKINQIGEKHLGFVLPKKQTFLNSDPISVLRGAGPAAKAFVDFILSEEMQKKLAFKKGVPQGPTHEPLGRMAVNKNVYLPENQSSILSLDPFKMEPPSFSIDIQKWSQMQTVMADLFGAWIIDPHNELKKLWKSAQTHGKIQELKKLMFMPMQEKDLEKWILVWKDPQIRSQQIVTWQNQAKQQRELARSTLKL